MTLSLLLIDAHLILTLPDYHMQPQEYRVSMTGWPSFVMTFHNLGILIGQTTKQGKRKETMYQNFLGQTLTLIHY